MMGMKGPEQAIWKISNAASANSGAKFDFNNVGLALQISILIIAIWLTFYYTKKQKRLIINPN